MAQLSSYDYIGSWGYSGMDIWESIDDIAFGIASDNPFGPYNLCSTNNWEDISTLSDDSSITSCSNSSDKCAFKDKISKNTWSERSDGTLSWEDAIEYCKNLTNNGITTWRLPSQKELITTFIRGIYSINSTNFLNANSTLQYWTSTTYSSNTDQAWVVGIVDAYTFSANKTNNSEYPVTCIAD